MIAGNWTGWAPNTLTVTNAWVRFPAEAFRLAVTSDVTIVGKLLTVYRAIGAAEKLAAEGIEAEVIDPRSLVPFDWETVKASVAKTGRVVIVEESPKRGGIGAEIAATVTEKAFEWLDAPILRVTAPDTPVPYSPPLEKAFLPNVNTLLAAARKLVKY